MRLKAVPPAYYLVQRNYPENNIDYFYYDFFIY